MKKKKNLHSRKRKSGVEGSKEYQSPRLTRYGNLKDLTKATGSGVLDGGSLMPSVG